MSERPQWREWGKLWRVAACLLLYSNESKRAKGREKSAPIRFIITVPFRCAASTPLTGIWGRSVRAKFNRSITCADSQSCMYLTVVDQQFKLVNVIIYSTTNHFYFLPKKKSATIRDWRYRKNKNNLIVDAWVYWRGIYLRLKLNCFEAEKSLPS